MLEESGELPETRLLDGIERTLVEVSLGGARANAAKASASAPDPSILTLPWLGCAGIDADPAPF